MKEIRDYYQRLTNVLKSEPVGTDTFKRVGQDFNLFFESLEPEQRAELVKQMPLPLNVPFKEVKGVSLVVLEQESEPAPQKPLKASKPPGRPKKGQ